MTVNQKIAELVNWGQVVESLAKIMGCAPHQRAVAAELGLSDNHFSMKKKRGTLLMDIVAWCLTNHVSLDWLLTGEDPCTQSRAAPDQACINLPAHEKRPLEAAEKLLLEKALTVLRTPGVTGDPDQALAQNIEAFYGAVEMHRRMMGGATGASGSSREGGGKAAPAKAGSKKGKANAA